MEQIDIRVYAAARYENVRALCHSLREKDENRSEDAVWGAAELLYQLLPKEVWIIPIPSHNGQADITKRLAICLQAKAVFRKDKVVGIVPGLTGKARESLYECKTAGRDITGIDLGFKADRNMKELIAIAKKQSVPVVLLDTVVDTGTTVRAAVKATGVTRVLCVGVTENFN